MTRSNRLATLAATLLLSVSCTTDPTDVASGGLRFTGEIPATRTQYIIDEETKTAHVEWKANDEIRIFTADGTSGSYRATTAGTTTDFVFWYGYPLPMQKDLTYYACYPYSEYSQGSAILVPDLAPSTDPAAVDFMYASAKADAQGNVRFRFKHAYATLAISISNAICPDQVNPKIEKIILYDRWSTEFDIEKGEFINNSRAEMHLQADFALSEEPITIYVPLKPTSNIQNYSPTFSLIVNGKEYFTNQKQLPTGGLKSGVIYRIDFDRENEQYIESLAQDRAALIALYNAMGGANWEYKDNWCSDKPLNEWYGIEFYVERVSRLSLSGNNVKGYIPKEIGLLTHLQDLSFGYNEISGTIPAELGNLTNLRELSLPLNQLSGAIPAELGNLTNLNDLDLRYNTLSGKVPSEVMALDVWKKCGAETVITNQGLDVESANAYYPEFTHQDIDGSTIHSSTKFKAKKYTAILSWTTWCGFSHMLISELIPIYNTYRHKGFEVIGFCADGKSKTEAAKDLIQQYQMNWCTILEDSGVIVREYPTVVIVDDTGLLKWRGVGVNISQPISAFLESKLGVGEELYASTDYSADGKVMTLQTATEGEGIDIVLMGDAFSDRLIADGTYEATMRKAMEYFFTEEPYASFRHLFNVYAVTAVSKNETFTHNGPSTALSGYFGDGTRVGGNDKKCKEYALKVPGMTNAKLDDAMIIVMMNSILYAGTCYMYYPTDGDHGQGLSVAYFPLGGSNEMFEQVLHHEAGGHGFPKLDDEYFYEDYGRIPQAEIEKMHKLSNFGWSKNVDVTPILSSVKWSRFISDARYANEKLGAYEGACTYAYGAYRPTQTSIMVSNEGGFNAPSREAIYYRIHKLAYGTSWTYDYETFVAWDAKNRTKARMMLRNNYAPPKNFVPLHPPVIVHKNLP